MTLLQRSQGYFKDRLFWNVSAAIAIGLLIGHAAVPAATLPIFQIVFMIICMRLAPDIGRFFTASS